MKISTRSIVTSAVIGAAYAALTMLLAPISYGPFQFRVSEALCILPYFIPGSMWGLFVGCAAANLISAAGVIDVVFGSLATLLASVCIARIGKTARAGAASLPNSEEPARWGREILACAMPVVFNGPIIGAVLAYTYMPGELFLRGMAIFGLQVAFGELVIMYALGLPLIRLLPKLGGFRELCDKANS